MQNLKIEVQSLIKKQKKELKDLQEQEVEKYDEAIEIDIACAKLETLEEVLKLIKKHG